MFEVIVGPCQFILLSFCFMLLARDKRFNEKLAAFHGEIFATKAAKNIYRASLIMLVSSLCWLVSYVFF